MLLLVPLASLADDLVAPSLQCTSGGQHGEGGERLDFESCSWGMNVPGNAVGTGGEGRKVLRGTQTSGGTTGWVVMTFTEGEVTVGGAGWRGERGSWKFVV